MAYQCHLENQGRKLIVGFTDDVIDDEVVSAVAERYARDATVESGQSITLPR